MAQVEPDKIPYSLLVVDDDSGFRETVIQGLRVLGYDIEGAVDGISAMNAIQKKAYDVVILDIEMPRVGGLEVLEYVKANTVDTQVIMSTGVNDVKVAVECMQRGASSYVTKPYTLEELEARIEKALERKRLFLHRKAFRTELDKVRPWGEIITTSEVMQQMLTLARKVAPGHSSVLIQGATGTGKELLAAFVHGQSDRKDNPFMTVNCSSIPDPLIESELFGHEKGAFTDAIAVKQGIVEIANGGTLFLDEVGDVSMAVQAKLLRFLQSGEYRRVGGVSNRLSDVRVVSATNKDLLTMVRNGQFREDLFFRLNVVTLRLPMLRERREDIPLLVDHMLRKKAGPDGPKTIDARSLELLIRYDWPGNIRELENVIERAVIVSDGPVVRPEHLALSYGMMVVQGATGGSNESSGGIGAPVTLEEIEKNHIDAVLRSVGWNKNTAAEILGISLRTLYTKIQQFNISKPAQT